MRPTTTVIFITKSVPQPFEHKELCKSTLSLDSTSSRKDCPRHCQSLAGMEDVDSEKQKPLPFHFQTPCLQFTKDESKARIHWQAKGNVVANHKQHMVNSVSKENKTSLYSLWMPSAEAKRKHEALLAELRQGTSWLNMYQTTAKVCEPEKPLPHNFAMPMVELHSSDKTLARIHWQQRGAIVAQHAKHLKQYNGKDKKRCRKHRSTLSLQQLQGNMKH